MFFDVYFHTPFFLVPTFYFFTGMIKGPGVPNTPFIWPENYGQQEEIPSVSEQLQKIKTQLSNEWLEASFGSMLFWTPVQFINFTTVPQYARIPFITSCSFFHKSWLSWVSNRERRAEKAECRK
jgi:hypothetical protein